MNFMSYVGFALCLAVMIGYFAIFLRDRYSRVKTVKAVVIHKQPVETFSKYAGNGKHVRYCVTFLAGKKKLHFYVSELSYKGFRLNENGTLKYKGSRLIDFR